jgi:hypothetical protein
MVPNGAAKPLIAIIARALIAMVKTTIRKTTVVGSTGEGTAANESMGLENTNGSMGVEITAPTLVEKIMRRVMNMAHVSESPMVATVIAAMAAEPLVDTAVLRAALAGQTMEATGPKATVDPRTDKA